MPIPVPWKGLIRFVADEDGQIYCGKPVVSNDGFDLGYVGKADGLEVQVIEGPNAFDPSGCTITPAIFTIRRLHGPLTPESVPTVRCIGGDYMNHCK